MCWGDVCPAQYIPDPLGSAAESFTVKGASGKPLPSTDPDLHVVRISSIELVSLVS
jgi:hypothetical protein